MRMLVVNAGSSSLKLTLLDAGDNVVADANLPAPGSTVDAGELRRTLEDRFAQAEVVAHRIVHGGERRQAVWIDTAVREELQHLSELAPLHQPKSLAALDLVSDAFPGIPAVACFDTAFHATLPPAAQTYALPAPWRERWKLRRYGFHGLSHAWVGRRTPQLLDRSGTELRIVSCHLGAGASLCAIQGGRSVDTTMGFTPLEGLVMATRSGSVDPGLLLWLLQHTGTSQRRLAEALEHESGLKGLAGTADMPRVLADAGRGDGAAHLAREVYLHSLRAAIAAMAAALGGLDALAFTGGVGEHSAEIRSRSAAGLAFLGIALDEQRNHTGGGDREIGDQQAGVRTLVIAAREDLEIARQTRRLLE